MNAFVKLWHDDIRRAPEGWIWARTNDQARRVLEKGIVAEISMDHDLGLDDLDPDAHYELDGELQHAIFLAGHSEDTGYNLVKWMCETGNVPEKVTIHSWNPQGAGRMATHLNDFGYDCIVSPFDPNRKEY